VGLKALIRNYKLKQQETLNKINYLKNRKIMMTLNKRLKGILLGVAFILAIPLVAMQFTTEVNWDLFDFVVMGTLLLATGLTCEFIMRKVKNKDYRIGIIALVLVALFLIWAELAVGNCGTPFAVNQKENP
jgi:hypothetical protein